MNNICHVRKFPFLKPSPGRYYYVLLSYPKIIFKLKYGNKVVTMINTMVNNN